MNAIGEKNELKVSDNEVKEEIQKVIKDIEDFIDSIAEILSPFWEKGKVRNWQKEINDAITELLQEFQK